MQAKVQPVTAAFWWMAAWLTGIGSIIIITSNHNNSGAAGKTGCYELYYRSYVLYDD